MPRAAAKKATAAAGPAFETNWFAVPELYLHPLNMRSEPPEDEIAAFAASIREVGLLQNLLGYRDPGQPGVGIVAGGKRLRALQRLMAEGVDILAPVQVTDDEAKAADWAVAENEARTPPKITDEIAAYGRMAARGHAADRIAAAFAVTTRRVRQLTRLAELPQPILDALAEGRMGLDAAAAFTLAPPDKAMEVFTSQPAGHISDWNVRRHLTEGRIFATDRRARFLGVSAYIEAGGAITEDLFGDRSILHDEALLDRMFAERLEAARLEAATDGWAWAEASTETFPRVHDRFDMEDPVAPELPEGDQEDLERLYEADPDTLTDDDRARLTDLEARAEPFYPDEVKARTGVLVYVDGGGKLQTYEGLVARGTKPDAADAAGDAPAPPAPKALPETLRTDLQNIRRGATQAALLDHPDLALDLLAFHLIVRARTRFSHILTGSLDPQPIGLHDDSPVGWPKALTYPTDPIEGVAVLDASKADHFLQLRARADWTAVRTQVLTHAIARAFNAIPTPLTEAIEALAGADARAHWDPDAKTYFKRVTDADLISIRAEVMEPEDDEAAATAFARLKKGDKAKELERLFSGDAQFREAHGLTREQADRVDRWLPPSLRRQTAEARADGGAA